MCRSFPQKTPRICSHRRGLKSGASSQPPVLEGGSNCRYLMRFSAGDALKLIDWLNNPHTLFSRPSLAANWTKITPAGSLGLEFDTPIPQTQNTTVAPSERHSSLPGKGLASNHHPLRKTCLHNDNSSYHSSIFSYWGWFQTINSATPSRLSSGQNSQHAAKTEPTKNRCQGHLNKANPFYTIFKL